MAEQKEGGRLHSMFIPAKERGVTGPDSTGAVGISFDIEGGTIRLSIKSEEIESFAKSILSYLHYKRSQSAKSSGMPSSDVPGTPETE